MPIPVKSAQGLITQYPEIAKTFYLVEAVSTLIPDWSPESRRLPGRVCKAVAKALGHLLRTDLAGQAVEAQQVALQAYTLALDTALLALGMDLSAPATDQVQYRMSATSEAIAALERIEAADLVLSPFPPAGSNLRSDLQALLGGVDIA